MQKILEESDDIGHNINHMQKRGNNNDKNSQRKNIWIVDIGAIDHVAHKKDCFTTFFRIKPVKIKLPNNNDVIANFASTFSIF